MFIPLYDLDLDIYCQSYDLNNLQQVLTVARYSLKVIKKKIKKKNVSFLLYYIEQKFSALK